MNDELNFYLLVLFLLLQEWKYEIWNIHIFIVKLYEKFKYGYLNFIWILKVSQTVKNELNILINFNFAFQSTTLDRI